MKDSQFIRDFTQIKASAKLAETLRGRSIGSKVGTVSVREDPLGLRRIKVVFPDKPGLDSYWIMRSDGAGNVDQPVPKLGQTVRVEFIDGDTTKGVYSVIANATNLPHKTLNELDDYSQIVEADHHTNVVGDKTVGSGKNIINTALESISNSADVDINNVAKNDVNIGSGNDTNIVANNDVNISADNNIVEQADKEIIQQAGQKITIKTTAATSIVINANGSIALTSAAVISVNVPLLELNTGAITFGGYSGGAVANANFNIGNINFVNTDSFKVNGKSIALVGGKDSDGDTIVTSGI